MDKDTRNTLRNVVTNCRQLLEEAVAQMLEGQYGVYRSGRVEDASRMGHLSPDELAVRERIVAHLEHIRSGGFEPADAADQLIREIAFTHLNRLAAYKMMEQRGLIREAVSRGVKSQGFMFYLADHTDDERLWSTGQQELAYRHFLIWQGAQFADEISVLFSPHDPANFVFPPQRVLDQVLDLINSAALADIWTADETIGWVYQYFTPKELRDKARSESQAPRNSYELAFRNQFYTPRYVVEFLTDNTLGRTWYEMLQGDTALIDHCRYLVRRPNEIFFRHPPSPHERHPRFPFYADVLRGDFEALPETLSWDELEQLALMIDGYRAATQLGLGECGDFANSVAQRFGESRLLPSSSAELWICLFYEQRRYRHFGTDPEGEAWEYIQALYKALRATLTRDTSTLSQEELLQQPVYIRYRAQKDPRRLKVLDPACGSGHFLLYAFDLLAIIYEEAWERDLTDAELGWNLREEYPTLDDLRCDIPRLILRDNLHGIDIDRRATQIAALALWLRAQRYYNDHQIDRKNRPAITQGNIVVAEPMPGDRVLLDEFVAELEPPIDQMVKRVFNEMRLAGEAGSLLKIEEAIQDDVARAREEWERRLRQQQTAQQMALLPEWIEKKPEQLALFDVSRITDAEFFDRAEQLVLEALEAYAQRAENGFGLRRRLFADDAAEGFAFVELMRQHYDVVLMNPPFGLPSKNIKSYVDATFPDSKRDLYSIFVERMLNLTAHGCVGTISSRTGFFLNSLQSWRENIVIGKSTVDVFADLGNDVLDALVETAAYCLFTGSSRRESASAVFLRLLDIPGDSKDQELLRLASTVDDYETNRVFISVPSTYRSIPGAPFAYWLPPSLRNLFVKLEPVESLGREARVGIQTSDDFRFVRLWPEVSPSSILCPEAKENLSDEEFRAICIKQTHLGKRWVSHAKGGEYRPYSSNQHLLLDWLNDGEEVKEYNENLYGSVSRNVRSESKYFIPGITWSRLPNIRGSFRILPPASIFSSGGLGLFVSDDLIMAAMAVLNSDAFFALLRAFMPRGTAGTGTTLKYEVGFVQKVPFPNLSDNTISMLSTLVQEAHDLWQIDDFSDELTPIYHSADVLLNFRRNSLGEAVEQYHNAKINRQHEKATIQKEIDDWVLSAYGLTTEDGEWIREELSQNDSDDSIGNKELPDEPVGSDNYISSLISWIVGVPFGRWDIRCVLRLSEFAAVSSPYDPLPACPPGMLQDAEGLPATETPPGYPLDIDWDGILVDDPGHDDDIIRRVRGVLDVLWGDRAEAIEQEACEILGVKTLRDYFRKPGNGGFWDDHVKRYSKSRRKAPIYWLLQSSRKNYALWLYYHRLDKDLYYKALINYVQPKLRLERSKLDALRAQLAGAGVAGREAKRLEREVEQQEALMSELQDFHDALERAAQLNLVPDLNDGVVLNIAPLHELVPWKEAEKYWKALRKGEYQWSTISQQLRDKGLVK